MSAVHSMPLPFLRLMETCADEAVKKQVESGFLETTVYHLPATAEGLLPMYSDTARKHLVRFEGDCLTC